MELCGFRTEHCPPGVHTGDAVSPPGGYVGGGLQMQVDVGILGHANPQITLGIYTETALEDMRRAIDELEKVLFPTVPKLQL